MQGVVAGWGTTLGGPAEPPPEGDEHGGHNDEQAQRYAGDCHNVVGLRWGVGLKGRWTGGTES